MGSLLEKTRKPAFKKSYDGHGAAHEIDLAAPDFEQDATLPALGTLLPSVLDFAFKGGP